MKHLLSKGLMLLLFVGVLTGLAASSVPASAQSYYFAVDEEIVDVYWESDGTARIEYIFLFRNSAGASPIDYVDVGLPTDEYSPSNAEAKINGNPVGYIGESEYVNPGVEVYLGSYAIPAGQSGRLWFSISDVGNVLYNDSDDEAYASANFAPTYFASEFVNGSTDLTVRFHFPPGVQPDEPRWHESPRNWPQSEPDRGFDSQDRIVYTWRNPQANAYTEYVFGASFPRSYVPDSAVRRPSVAQQFGIPEEVLIMLCCLGGFFTLIIGIIVLAVRQAQKRKLDYLPPKLSIEGHGIKRGLTAVEAAVLLETPLDRVLTMMLFATIKKNAVKVVKEDPLELERLPSPTSELRPYEEEFLKTMVDTPERKRRRALQSVVIDLVKTVQKKMKGFSLKETKDYYQAIMKKAWEQIEQAETPEIRSERYEQALEWTMLDDEFDDQTRRVFRTGPVYVPMWWGHYRPSYSGTAGPARTSSSRPSSGAPGGGLTLPTLPGAEFASAMVTGVQNTAGNIVSDLTSFTGGVTDKTNPPPVRTTSSGGGFRGGSSGGCACACACAGCACACAGGGR